jgi:APA family basic amino acid/polyamine antiporter
MKLKKDLNLLDVFSVTAGAMISSGLFILPGLAHAQAGPAIVISYLLAGLLAVPGMLSQSELASAMPKAGGTYYYITRSLGPAVGTVYGLITWFALSLKSAFALVGMAAFTILVFSVNSYVISVSLCLVFVLINIIGIKGSGRIQVVLVFSILTALLVYLIFGLPSVRVHHLIPFAPNGVQSVFATAGFVFVSYGGLINVASVAEEVKNPGRVLPLGMILSIIVVGLFYFLVIFVTTGVLDSAALDNSLTPISDGAGAFMGLWGKILLSVVAILAFSSAANAGIMAASRYPMALGRDGLLPQFFGRIGSRFKTPHVSILITGIFIVLSMLMELNLLVKAASSVIILTYIFTCIAIIILRESRLQNYQPSFRAPLYPWIQVVGIVGCGFILYRIGYEAVITSVIFIVSGLFVFWLYGRIKKIRIEREYALLHLIERITAKELTTHSLEAELKEVIRERDDIVKDRFDHLIEESVILDLDGAISVEDFFRLAADKMADNLHVDSGTLYRSLLERERASSTALTKNLAIPHIIIEGEHTFDILVARCREGIAFSDSVPAVHAAFVLIGTMDERNFHLCALAAIAQIVQDHHFEKKWMLAKTREALRDIVLLGKRKR